jgi:hypothetical protein
MNNEFGMVQLQGGCRLTVTNAEFDEGMSFESWLKNGQRLCQVGASVAWWIGAWVNAGERMFGLSNDEPGTPRQVTKYARAMEVTGYAYQTLADAAWVEGAVPVSFRKETLSWSHHREVAHLEAKDQQKFLQLASEGQWSVSQLRQAIRKDMATEAEQPTLRGPLGFVLSKPVGDIMRWFRVQLEEQPVDDMPKERREALKRELRPIVDVYETL